MAGLNPNGLGRNRSFDDTESDSLSTESATIGGVPSDLHWERDPNSLGDVSGDNSYSFNLDGEYDSVLLNIKELEGGDNGTLELQLNGDTGANYGYTSYSGNTTSGATSIQITSDRRHVENVWLMIDGTFYDTATVNVASGVAGSGEAAIGRNGSISSPLSSITVSSGNVFPARIVAYGGDTQ